MTPPTAEERRRRVQQGSRRRRDLEGAAVTTEERAIAKAALAAFNAAAGTSYSLEAHLVPLLGRIFEHPELSADDHGQIIAANFREPWWTSRPGVAVIYGSAGQFERSLEAWRRPSGAAAQTPRAALAAARDEAKRERLRAEGDATIEGDS